MSGAEVGLILSILPLVISAAKAYKSGVDTIVDAVSASRHDEKLENYYLDVYWEVNMLDRQLRDIVFALPALDDNFKTAVLKPENLGQWEEGSTVVKALQSFFGSDADYQSFTVVIGKIVRLLSQLIEVEGGKRASSKEMDQQGMDLRLKAFGEQRRKKTTNSNVIQRVQFFRKSKDRETCLRALRTWNKRLLSLTEDARREPYTRRNNQNVPTANSAEMRELSRVVRGLRLVPRHADGKADMAQEFNFLFGRSPVKDPDTPLFLESTFRIRPKEETSKYDCMPLERICDALTYEIGPATFNFLIAHARAATDEPTVWQLRPEPKTSALAPSVSLQSVLCSPRRLPLLAKRKLAVILSRSLLDFHESLWLGSGWTKQNITFFPESGTVDYQKPYVVTDFTRTDQAKPDLRLFHPNASILALGILLLEIHTDRPIESFRVPADLTNGVTPNVNTDWSVANRVAKSLDDCSLNYKEAIQACLDVPWITAGQRVSFDDEATRAGFFNEVVRPLEEELRHLFRERF